MVEPKEDTLDEFLVLSAQAGEPKAFQALVTRWQERLWRHALRLVSREDAAWDVLQETWMAVVRKLPKLEDASRFRPWIYRITTRRATDWLRERHRAPEALPEETPEPASSSSSAEGIRGALAGLDGSTRIVLSLHHLEGFSVKEIATILEAPEGTIKSRLHRAREQLRLALERNPT